ncbi:ATP-binding protein, partial [Novosphingobium sp. MBES04]|uniref:ATP-binding protein n=1 Tax=Novosphingobium sp. MBES04 TaxID=1206458 RepID=UPI00131EE6F5
GDGVSGIPSGGSLFPPPPGTTAERQLTFYQTCKNGWQLCPMGYAVYCFNLVPERNVRLAIFGLKIIGYSKAQGKLEGLSIKTNRSDVENYAKKSVSTIEAVESRLQTIVSSGVHEFRNVNKDLYNTAYALESDLSNSYNIQCSHREAAKSIVELSEMMKSRSDIFDVITNPSIAQIKDQNVHVYRAFDRARKSMMSSSMSRKLRLEMSGSSNSRAKAVQMFDVVPYIILQNAAKYSPDNNNIEINIEEFENNIVARTSSLGPVLLDDELVQVFSPGFRGKRAQDFESQGSGMGLFVVKRLIDFCDGAQIKLAQGGPSVFFHDREFKFTTVSVTLSIAA